MRKAVILNFISFFAILLFSNYAYPQCTIENNLEYPSFAYTELNHTGETHSYGQSFVPNCTGNIEYFEISNSSGLQGSFSVASIEIYEGANIDSTPIYTQQYNEVWTFFTGDAFRFVIDENIELSSGNTYTIVINSMNGARFLISNHDSYNFGSAIIDGVVQPNIDLFFKVHLSDPNNNCNVGNEFLMSDSTLTYLLNQIIIFRSISISEPAYLTGLGFTGISTSCQIRMALYDNLSNAPSNLIAETAIETFDSGMQILPVDPVVLNPGEYWIAFMIDGPVNDAEVWRYKSNEPDEVFYYKYLEAFNQQLPNPFEGGTLSTTDTQHPVFAEISCDFLSDPQFESTEIKIFPNPTSEKLYVKGITDSINYTIYSLLGEKVNSGKIMSNSFINVSCFNTGIYIIKFQDGSNLKFLKL